MDKRGTGHINRVYRGGAGMARAYFGLTRWGITLILPESLPAFQEIVIADRRMNRDEQLVLGIKEQWEFEDFLEEEDWIYM